MPDIPHQPPSGRAQPPEVPPKQGLEPIGDSEATRPDASKGKLPPIVEEKSHWSTTSTTPSLDPHERRLLIGQLLVALVSLAGTIVSLGMVIVNATSKPTPFSPMFMVLLVCSAVLLGSIAGLISWHVKLKRRDNLEDLAQAERGEGTMGQTGAGSPQPHGFNEKDTSRGPSKSKMPRHDANKKRSSIPGFRGLSIRSRTRQHSPPPSKSRGNQSFNVLTELSYTSQTQPVVETAEVQPLRTPGPARLTHHSERTEPRTPTPIFTPTARTPSPPPPIPAAPSLPTPPLPAPRPRPARQPALAAFARASLARSISNGSSSAAATFSPPRRHSIDGSVTPGPRPGPGRGSSDSPAPALPARNPARLRPWWSAHFRAPASDRLAFLRPGRASPVPLTDPTPRPARRDSLPGWRAHARARGPHPFAARAVPQRAAFDTADPDAEDEGELHPPFHWHGQHAGPASSRADPAPRGRQGSWFRSRSESRASGAGGDALDGGGRSRESESPGAVEGQLGDGADDATLKQMRLRSVGSQTDFERELG